MNKLPTSLRHLFTSQRNSQLAVIFSPHNSVGEAPSFGMDDRVSLLSKDRPGYVPVQHQWSVPRDVRTVFSPGVQAVRA